MTTNRFFCLLLALFLANFGLAQNNNIYTARSARDMYARATSFVGVTGGYSRLLESPLSSTDYSDANAGFIAPEGFGGGVYGAYFFSPNFGVGAAAFYQTFATQGADKLAEGYRIANAADSCRVLRNGRYNQIGGLLGPVFTVSGGSVSFDLKALAGVVQSELPGMQVFLNQNPNVALEQQRATALAFAWQAGVALRIHASEYISIGLHADYCSIAPHFTLENMVETGFLGKQKTAYTPSVNGVYAGIGLFYDFAE